MDEYNPTRQLISQAMLQFAEAWACGDVMNATKKREAVLDYVDSIKKTATDALNLTARPPMVIPKPTEEKSETDFRAGFEAGAEWGSYDSYLRGNQTEEDRIKQDWTAYAGKDCPSCRNKAILNAAGCCAACEEAYDVEHDKTRT